MEAAPADLLIQTQMASQRWTESVTADSERLKQVQ